MQTNSKGEAAILPTRVDRLTVVGMELERFGTSFHERWRVQSKKRKAEAMVMRTLPGEGPASEFLLYDEEKLLSFFLSTLIMC